MTGARRSPGAVPPNGIITLLTDFGLGDTYVGAVKGAILSVAPRATLVDVTHQVPPQAIHRAAFLLGSVWHTFPVGTVHLAVADPGVGTARRALLLMGHGHYFVGPDNGIFTYALWPRLIAPQAGRGLLEPFLTRVPQGFRAFVLDQARYWRRPVSPTFQARDLFGPVAAHLVAGSPPQHMGTPTQEVSAIYVPASSWRGDRLEGAVLHVDTFGNLVTSIRGDLMQGAHVRIAVAARTIVGITSTYGEGHGLVAVVGSHGFLEIAVPMGNAARELGIGEGAPVLVQRMA